MSAHSDTSDARGTSAAGDQTDKRREDQSGDVSSHGVPAPVDGSDLAQTDSLSELTDAAREIADTQSNARYVPEAAIARLATYLRVLSGWVDEAISTCSSGELAMATGVNSAMLRKDLSYLGSYGIRGVGYDVQRLTGQIARALGVTVHRSVALIGVGNLGQALAGYAGFASRGFQIAALVDADPARIGTQVYGRTVQDVADLEQIVADENITIAVLAIPAAAAQEVCDQLVAAGVTSILNFAPTVLAVPHHVDVRKVDLAAELQILSFHENRKASPALEAKIQVQVAPSAVAQ